jgi:hypothetical protein
MKMVKSSFLSAIVGVFLMGSGDCGGPAAVCASFQKAYDCYNHLDESGKAICTWNPEVKTVPASCRTLSRLGTCPDASLGKEACQKVTGPLQNCYYYPAVQEQAAYCGEKP